MIKIYTDGSYKPSTNKGGYGVVIVNNGEIEKILYQGYQNTTNNRMELLAFIAALEYYKESTELTIYSDSSYLVSSINNGHLNN